MFLTTPLDVRIAANLSSPDWWTIGLTAAATIFGAIIGAVIAYVIARQTARESRTTQREARRAAEEAATLRAEIKVVDLVNLAAGYHNQVERVIEEGKRDIGDQNVETWKVMRAFVGKPVEIHMDADDLIVFTRSRKFGYVTDLLRAVSAYNSMIYGVEAYGRQRDALMAQITPYEMDGLIGKTAIHHDHYMKLAPYMATVEKLANDMRKEIEDVYTASLKASDDFGPIVIKYFNDPKFPVPGRSKVEVAASTTGKSEQHGAGATFL
ncbi:MAG TPA: hypothetical protein VHY79_07080 [Rhizomicrobium sp.]|jgi:gas vesicle protein|nr:hypothetical protein [Rhizomicrobium sp.]